MVGLKELQLSFFGAAAAGWRPLRRLTSCGGTATVSADDPPGRQAGGAALDRCPGPPGAPVTPALSQGPAPWVGGIGQDGNGLALTDADDPVSAGAVRS
ncbi:hypothetical protein GCM10009647_085670 [Streptomyces sanglieri]